MLSSPRLTGLLVLSMGLIACAEQRPSVVEPAEASLHGHPGSTAAASGDIHTPGGITLEPLAVGSFPHEIDAMFKFRHARAMQVVHVRDASRAIVARLTIQEAGSAGWHRHPGTAIINVVSATFGVIEETDCVLRTYEPGQVAFHRGQGIRDVGFNAGHGEMVAYVTFLGVPPGEAATIPLGPDEPIPC